MGHESDTEEGLRRVRLDAQDDAEAEGYVDGTGAVRRRTGDEDGPYTLPLGVASSDASAGLTSASDGDAQRLATDPQGVLWTRPLTSALGVQQVEGDIAHDAAETAAANPVKIGGIAVANVPTAVAGADRVNAAFDLFGALHTINMPDKGNDTAWVADAALAAAGAFTGSGIIDLRYHTRLCLRYRYSPGAVGGYPHVILRFASTAAQPLITDDVWYSPPANQGIVTPVLLSAGSLPAGVDETRTPEWGQETVRPRVVAMELGDGASDEIRFYEPFDIRDQKWASLLYAERGVVATPGTFGADYNLSR